MTRRLLLIGAILLAGCMVTPINIPDPTNAPKDSGARQDGAPIYGSDLNDKQPPDGGMKKDRGTSRDAGPAPTADGPARDGLGGEGSHDALRGDGGQEAGSGDAGPPPLVEAGAGG